MSNIYQRMKLLTDRQWTALAAASMKPLQFTPDMGWHTEGADEFWNEHTIKWLLAQQLLHIVRLDGQKHAQITSRGKYWLREHETIRSAA